MQDWVSIARLSDQLAQIDPASADPDGLATEARTRLMGALSSDIGALIADRSSLAGATPGPARERPRNLYVPDPQTLEVGQWVSAVTFSPDGTRLATGSRQRVRVWDLRNGEVLWEAKIGGRIHDVSAVAFSPDGTRLATASEDGTAHLWDARSGEQQLQVTHEGRGLRGITLRPGRLVWPYGVAFSPDGTRLATASPDGTARVWDARNGEQVLEVAHGGSGPRGIHGVAFSPDGTRLATASADGTARVWDARSGEQLLEVTHGGSIEAAFSPDGTRLATTTSRRRVRVWDLRNGEVLWEAKIGVWSEEGSAVAFSPDGTRLATGCGQRLRVWDLDNGEVLWEAKSHDVTAVAFSPDGTRLATGGQERTAQVWDATTRPVTS